jgi:hypothetical protein
VDETWDILRISWGRDIRDEMVAHDDGWEPFAVLGVGLNREVWYRRRSESLGSVRPVFKDGDLVGIERAEETADG